MKKVAKSTIFDGGGSQGPISAIASTKYGELAWQIETGHPFGALSRLQQGMEAWPFELTQIGQTNVMPAKTAVNIKIATV